MLRAWAADATPILSRPISVDDFDNQTGALTFFVSRSRARAPATGCAAGWQYPDRDRPLR